MFDGEFCTQETGSGRPPPALQDWYGGIPGNQLLQAERGLVADLTRGMFGYHLLQIGGFGNDLGYLDECRVRSKHIISGAPPLRVDNPHLLSLADALPIANDSVDIVVLPHTLDFSADPQAVLREVERVLIPEGRLIVVGFNPLSLWGLWHLARQGRGQLPWCGHFVSYPRLLDWLSLLGLDVERTDLCGFRPPFGSARVHQRLQLLEQLGRRLWPMFAGVYVLRAVKRVARLRPIPHRWRPPRMIGTRVIEPTTREVTSG